MTQNILFILVDGLRADQCYGNDKESHTPFLDSLIDSGVYFSNTFSPADGTITSLNCMFNSKFQYETGIRAKKIILLENNHLQKLKELNYYTVGLIPKLTELQPLANLLENKECMYEPGPPPETLSTGMTDKISKLLTSLDNISKPWFCYIHLLDLHPLREGRSPLKIEEFEQEKFGNSTYAKTVSSIDYWLMKISKKINFDNTLFVFTGDHGERIPFGGKIDFQFEPELKQVSSIGKKLLPKASHKIGGKMMAKIKKSVGKSRVDHSNKDLTPYQKRSRDPYFTLSLHDELLHIPLLIKGKHLPSKNISQQVSNLDIFPTIFDIFGISYKKSKYRNSLFPLINNRKIPSWNIFLHTMPYQKESSLDRMGIRTSKFKYFRNSRNSKKDVHLYDLENDPYENNNIFEHNSEIIEKMEKKLYDMQKDSKKIDEKLIKEQEDHEMSQELKKMGYM